MSIVSRLSLSLRNVMQFEVFHSFIMLQTSFLLFFNEVPSDCQEAGWFEESSCRYLNPSEQFGNEHSDSRPAAASHLSDRGISLTLERLDDLEPLLDALPSCSHHR